MSILPINGSFSLQKSVSIIFVILAIFVTSALTYMSFEEEKNQIIDTVSKDLDIKAYELTTNTNIEIENVKTSLIQLKNSEISRSVFINENFKDNYELKNEITNTVKEIGEQIDEYIILHPQLSANDLVNDPEFRKIAIKKIGTEGYSALYQTESLIIGPHPNPEIEGKSLNAFKYSYPEFFELVKNSENRIITTGYYDWPDNTGVPRRKFQANYNSQIRTSDNITFSVTATDYLIEKEKIFSQTEKLEIKNFIDEKDYFDVFYIYSDELKYSYVNHNILNSQNLIDYHTNNINKIFDTINFDDEIYLDGPYILRGEGIDIYDFFAIIPYYKDSEIIGYIGIASKMDNIQKIIDTYSKEHKDLEISLINEEFFVIASNIYSEEQFMLQSIHSDNSENCFTTHESHELVSYENYHKELYEENFDEEIGTHLELAGINWCYLVNYDYHDVIDKKVNSLIKSYSIIFFTLVILVGIISYYLSKYYVINYKNKNKKLIRNKNIQSFIKWLIKALNSIKLNKKSVFYSLIFYIIIVLIIGFNSGGMNNYVYQISILNFLLYLPNILIFLYSFNLKNKAKKYISIASLLFSIYAILRLVSQYHLNASDETFCLYCSAVPVIAFISIILYLLGFSEVLSDES